MDFATLCDIVRHVKPSTAGRTLSPSDSLVEDLGLDSLDLLQLGRRVQKTARVPFVLEQWTAAERAKAHGPRFTIESLLSAVAVLAAGQGA